MKTFNVKFNDKTYAVTAKDEEHAVEVLKTTLRTRDEAASRTTIEALISDEKAAIDAYNLAIKNEDGKLSPEAIAVLRLIRDEEEKHTENLYAILSSNVTEKNLEDSVKDDDYVYAQIKAHLEAIASYSQYIARDKSFTRMRIETVVKELQDKVNAIKSLIEKV